MLYLYAISRRIMVGALPRLVKVSGDNTIGVLLLVITIAYDAHPHTWSRQAFLENVWETVVAPCLLLLSVLFSIHLVQAARQVCATHRRPFPNALGSTTNIPPWHLRWRIYLVAEKYENERRDGLAQRNGYS